VTPTTWLRYALGSSAALWLLAGCSGGSGAGPPTAILNSGKPAPSPAKRPADLAVAEYYAGSSLVNIYNKRYKKIAKISAGISEPFALWYDDAKNLYSANYNNSSGDVTEYADGTSTPSYTYSFGVNCPTGITTDKNLDVFISDSCVEGVTEFPQESYNQIGQCTGIAAPQNVALDAAGDVFVTYYDDTTGHGAIDEFAGGLNNGCNATNIVPSGSQGSFNSTDGLLVDKHNNLIVVDNANATVDIVPPPYTTISKYITGFKYPFRIALNAKQNLLYVTDRDLVEVVVVSYPQGVVKGAVAKGVMSPGGIAAYPQ
jgi:hypothetical protein